MRRLVSGVIAGCFVFIGVTFAQAGGEHDMKPYSGSPEFERMKTLAGKWEGTGMMEGKEEKIDVEYAVTSGGSTVVEKLSPGTPHEMVTTYYDEGGKLAMTHYCMLANRPHMKLTSEDKDKIALVMADDPLIDPNSMHMHALTITFTDADHISQDWQNYLDGKSGEHSVFNFARVK